MHQFQRGGDICPNEYNSSSSSNVTDQLRTVQQNKARNLSAGRIALSKMSNKAKSYLAILIGVIIVILDLWWTYASYPYEPWVAVGVVIFVASLIWTYLDYNLMKKQFS